MTYAEETLKIQSMSPKSDRFQPVIYSDGFYGVLDTKHYDEVEEEYAAVALCISLDEAIESAYGMSRCPQRLANDWTPSSLGGRG